MKPIFAKSVLLLFICFFIFSYTAFCGPKSKQEIYQLTVYQYTTTTQETILQNYLQNALLPALHRNGYKNIGVFTSLANDTTAIKLLYVYMPIKSLEVQLTLADKLNKDSVYLSAGDAYINAPYNNPVYTRMEVIYLKAFHLAPQMRLPKLTAARNERIYELRSYEAATEKIFKNKVHMFNEGKEIELFAKLNFNAVFYSEVIAGAHMPNLMYMTCFENKADRDAHWKSFVEDPLWKKISTMPEYQNNISHMDISFLKPTAYSDF
jgi:hypothetical protein